MFDRRFIQLRGFGNRGRLYSGHLRQSMVHQFHAAIEMLDDGGATIYPIAGVDVGKSLHVLDRGHVNVATDHAVDAAHSRRACDSGFIFIDVMHGAPDPVLDVGR